MRVSIDLDGLWTAFADIEREESLVEWRIGNVYIWPILRDRLFRDAAEQLGLIEAKIEPPRASNGNLGWQSEWPRIQSLMGPTIVIPFLRRDAENRAPFTERLARVLPQPASRLAVGAVDAASAAPQLEDLETFIRRRFSPIAKALVAASLRKKHFAKYSRMIAGIEAKTGPFTVKFARFPKWLLVDFVAQRLGYSRLFRALGVRQIVYVNAWRRGLIAGAHRAGVSVIEPQHGAISNRHPLLSWPADSKPAYLPDAFLAWGQYWLDSSALPSNVSTAVIGAPAHIEHLKGELASGTVATNENQIVIASQVHQTQAIIAFANEAARSNPSLFVVLKPHPQENPALFAQQVDHGLPNLRVADAAEPMLRLIAESAAVASVYSTALFEALALGKRAGVIKLAGWEHVAELLQRGDAAEAVAEDLHRVLKMPTKPAAGDYYFASAIPETDDGDARLGAQIQSILGSRNV